jgi:pentatricopeptide repeat protein
MLRNLKTFFPNKLFQVPKFTFNCIQFNPFVTNIKKTDYKFKKKKPPSKNRIKITQNNPLVEKNEISPTIREEIKNMSSFLSDKESLFYDNVMEKADAHNYMKMLDSTFEGFFFKREFTLKNFNYYLQVLTRQNKIPQAEEAFKKMQELGIIPDIETYTHLLTIHAKNKDIENSEKIFEIISSKFIPNKMVYNSLLLAYVKNKKLNEGEAIIREMKEKGLKPDIVCYTTLIHGFNKVGNYDKCWELYHEASNEVEVDEFILSYMIRICATTHDTSQALILWDLMELNGFTPNIMNYNSLLKALSCKIQYAQRAIDEFMKIKALGIKPDIYTYNYVIRACTHLGDIDTANNTLKEMKLMNIKVNKYICNELLRVYGGAIKQPFVKTEHIDQYIKDAWDIIKYMEAENLPIDVYILNSLLYVHCSAHKLELVEGLVVPLYEKHGVAMDGYTYEHIIRMLLDLREFLSIFNLYDKFKSRDLRPTPFLLNSVIEAGIRANKVDFIVECLQKFQDIKDEPEQKLIRLLTNIEEIPDRLYVELRRFRQYNKMTRRREFRPATFRERDRKLGAPFRKRGRRYSKMR